MLAERGADVGDRASEAWRESRPLRRDAAKRAARASADAASWSDGRGARRSAPCCRPLEAAHGCHRRGRCGGARPAASWSIPPPSGSGCASARKRHWGAFFLGLIIGAAAGAIAALLTTPKPRRRDAPRARRRRRRSHESASAKDGVGADLPARGDERRHGGRRVATGGGPADDVRHARSRMPPASAPRQRTGADETAEAINESYDTVDRETPAVGSSRNRSKGRPIWAGPSGIRTRRSAGAVRGLARGAEATPDALRARRRPPSRHAPAPRTCRHRRPWLARASPAALRLRRRRRSSRSTARAGFGASSWLLLGGRCRVVRGGRGRRAGFGFSSAAASVRRRVGLSGRAVRRGLGASASSSRRPPASRPTLRPG